MSEYVTMLENLKDLEVSIIRATKINKVLKAILKLESIPVRTTSISRTVPRFFWTSGLSYWLLKMPPLLLMPLTASMASRKPSQTTRRTIAARRLLKSQSLRPQRRKKPRLRNPRRPRRRRLRKHHKHQRLKRRRTM